MGLLQRLFGVSQDEQLRAAAKVGDLERVREAVESGANINSHDESGWTALHEAAMKGHRVIVEFLLAKGANVNGKHGRSYTPLINAVLKDRAEIVKLLITKGADVNLTEYVYGTPALHFAVRRGNVPIVITLLDSGADVNQKDNSGGTALKNAYERSDEALVELLQQRGASEIELNKLVQLNKSLT